MNMRLYTVIFGGFTALALAACKTESTSGTGGSGTGGSTTSTTTTGTGGAGGAGGATGTGGAGGAACVGCAEYITNGGTLCDASKPILDALGACICDAANCGTDCGDNLCAGKDATAACNTCSQAAATGACKPQADACLSDA